MASCNFCDKKITDVESLSLSYTCTKCVENQNNFVNTENEEIIYIDSNEKHFVINSDTELNINANLHPVSESAQEEEDETIYISLNRQLQEI